MRRFFASLLAVLVLLLSCLPCGDVEACAKAGEETVEVVMKPAVGHPHSPTQHADHCSPFCACACCAAVALPVFFAFDGTTLSDTVPKAEAAPILLAFPSIARPVWQPPQLA